MKASDLKRHRANQINTLDRWLHEAKLQFGAYDWVGNLNDVQVANNFRRWASTVEFGFL